MYRLNMFLIGALVTAPAVLWSQTTIPGNLVSFYEVPLACPAARGLGCGSAAKPALQALEKKTSIQEAWLDHPGTTLAIVWNKDAKGDLRSADIQSVADDRGIALHELTGERRNAALVSFASRNGWYRGSEVDRLSEEEAGVIVDRLLRRAAAKEPTIAGKADSVKSSLTKAIRDEFIACTSTQCREDAKKKLREIAHQKLNDREFRALMDAEREGYRPIGDEK